MNFNFTSVKPISKKKIQKHDFYFLLKSERNLIR